MKRGTVSALALSLVLGLSMPLIGCGSAADGTNRQATETVEAPADVKETQAIPDGTYEIVVTTDSSMFRSESCTLTVADGAYTATLKLPGEGFSRLYFGTAEQAQAAPDSDIYDYHLSDDGKYTFDLPVSALDEELKIAAFGQRRDTWYDHTITFVSPVLDQAS